MYTRRREWDGNGGPIQTNNGWKLPDLFQLLTNCAGAGPVGSSWHIHSLSEGSLLTGLFAVVGAGWHKLKGEWSTRSSRRLLPPLCLGRTRRAQWLQAGDSRSAAEATCHQQGGGTEPGQGKWGAREPPPLILCSHWKSERVGPRGCSMQRHCPWQRVVGAKQHPVPAQSLHGGQRLSNTTLPPEKVFKSSSAFPRGLTTHPLTCHSSALRADW